MKIKIAYQAEEQPQAEEITAYIRSRYKGVKLRKSDKYAPFLHSYLTIKKRDKPPDQGKNT